MDPGLVQTGIVLIKGSERFEVEKYYAPRSPREGSWWERTHDLKIMIHNWILENVNEKHCPFDLAIEEPFVPFDRGRIGAFGLQNRFLGTLYTFLRFNFQESLDRVYLVNPRSVKMHLTGKGNADKDKMVRCARRYTRLPIKQKPKEAIADAVGVAYAAWEHRRQGIKGVQEYGI